METVTSSRRQRGPCYLSLVHFLRRHLIGVLAVLASLPAAAQKDEELPFISSAEKLDPSSRAHPWAVPARVEGLWCGTGLLREFSLRLSQRHREVHGSLARRDRVRAIEGHMAGATLRTQATRHGSLVLEMTGDELRVTDGEGALALARGAAFQRANGSACNG